MKNAVKVLIFTVVFLAAAAGAVFGIYKYNKADFTFTVASKSDEIVLTAYNGDSVNIVIPKKIRGKKVVALGEGVFQGTDIKSVEIPETVTQIEGNAFKSCTKLEKAVIGSSVEKIGDSAFISCTSLKEVNIPASVKTIGGMPFNGCTQLKDITIEDGSGFVLDNGVLYNKDKTAAYFALNGVDFSNYEFPATVKDFQAFFFYGNETLKSFTVPGEMKKIPESMFVLCSNLENVSIPDGVTRICNSAFLGCTSLDRLYVPASVKTFEKFCFPVEAKKKDDKKKDKDDDNKKSESNVFNPDFTLVVEKGSAAYNYAKSNGIKYEIAK